MNFTIPFMISNLVFIPKVISLGALILLLITGFSELRKGYIGRISIAANAFLLWQIFYPVWIKLPDWFGWYLNLGTILGILAVIAYFAGHSLPDEFYQVCFILYGSLSIILVVGISIFYGIIPI